MPPRELRAFPKGIASFESAEWLPPDQLVIDTSVLVEFLVRSQPLHDPCVCLFDRLTESGSTIVCNALIETELAEALFRLALVERWGKSSWKRRRYDGRARRRADRLLQEGMSGWSELLEALNSRMIEHATVSDQVPRLMGRHGLSSYDAIHVATAIYANVPHVATLDYGFAGVPATQITLHTAGSRLKTMRARR